MSLVLVRRRRRRSFAIGERLRRMVRGLIYRGVGSALLTVASAFYSSIQSGLDFNVTIGGSTVTIPLGTVGSILLGFAGIFMLLYALRYLISVRL